MRYAQRTLHFDVSLMTCFRRAYVLGDTFFYTMVTERRAPYSLYGYLPRFPAHGQSRMPPTLAVPFRIDAMVLLDNHLHAIWTLPEGSWQPACREAK